VTEDGAWVTPYLLDPNDPNAIVAGYQNLWRSLDGGVTWNQLSTLNTSRKVQAIAVAPSNSDVMYFANDLDMYGTDDGGLSFITIGTALPDEVVTSIVVDPAFDQHLYVSLSGYADGEKVYESQDGGVTWTDRSGNLPNVPVNSLAYEPTSNGLYAGTDLGVFYWNDQLSDWQPFSQGLPNCIVTEVEVTPNTGKLRAATFGRGLWETDLYVPTGAPPTAGFSTSSTTICAGGSITFQDASLEAAPGWSWSFPGGQPSSSTDQQPVVTYTTAGTYTATLTVTNAFGSDDHTAPVLITILPNPVTVSVNFDNYPKETSWSITNDLTGQAVANGGPYFGHEALSSQTSTVCLDQGCYTFTIADSYGDGICCGQGNGSYTVSNPQLGTIVSGGTFTSSASTGFCVSQSVSMPSGVAMAALDVRPVDGEGLYTLSLEGNAAPLEMLVMDALGRTVLKERLTGRIDRHPLDLRAFSSGAYTVVLRGDHGTWTGRLMRP
jgi:PKD repeat protein